MIYPKLYISIFFHLVLAILFFSVVSNSIRGQNAKHSSISTTLFTIFLIIFIGLRPINGPGVWYYGDTVNYLSVFNHLAQGGYVESWKDPIFGYITEFFALHTSARTYLFFLAIFYIIPIYIACLRINKQNSYLLLLMIVVSLLFWTNGVNGLRAGIGSSLLFLGFTSKRVSIEQIVLFLLAIGFHESMLLPAGAYLLSILYSNSKVYIFFWLSSIVLSLTFGGFWENFFASFVDDDRFAGYLTGYVDPTLFSRSGFRWDFLIYSSIPVIAGYYYITHLGYTSVLYTRLFNTYLIANSFWILVIRANFSNRFAALSWFLLPIILIMPLLDSEKIQNSKGIVAAFLLLSYAFTYFGYTNIIW